MNTDGTAPALDDLRARLLAIERALDEQHYTPGPWQKLVEGLRAGRAADCAALADDLTRVSRKLHLRGARRTTSLTAGLLLEAFAATFGGVMLALGIARDSNMAAIIAMLLWVVSFQPLIKLAVGTALGIRYEYVYLFGLEPRFKMAFGSYIVAPPWRRVLLQLSGLIGSALGAALVALIADDRLHTATVIAWIVFWIVNTINFVALANGLVGGTRILRFRPEDSSGGMAVIELRAMLIKR